MTWEGKVTSPRLWATTEPHFKLRVSDPRAHGLNHRASLPLDNSQHSIIV